MPDYLDKYNQSKKLQSTSKYEFIDILNLLKIDQLKNKDINNEYKYVDEQISKYVNIDSNGQCISKPDLFDSNGMELIYDIIPVVSSDKKSDQAFLANITNVQGETFEKLFIKESSENRENGNYKCVMSYYIPQLISMEINPVTHWYDLLFFWREKEYIINIKSDNNIVSHNVQKSKIYQIMSLIDNSDKNFSMNIGFDQNKQVVVEKKWDIGNIQYKLNDKKKIIFNRTVDRKNIVPIKVDGIIKLSNQESRKVSKDKENKENRNNKISKFLSNKKDILKKIEGLENNLDSKDKKIKKGKEIQKEIIDLKNWVGTVSGLNDYKNEKKILNKIVNDCKSIESQIETKIVSYSMQKGIDKDIDMMAKYVTNIGEKLEEYQREFFNQQLKNNTVERIATKDIIVGSAEAMLYAYKEAIDAKQDKLAKSIQSSFVKYINIFTEEASNEHKTSLCDVIFGNRIVGNDFILGLKNILREIENHNIVECKVTSIDAKKILNNIQSLNENKDSINVKDIPINMYSKLARVFGSVCIKERPKPKRDLYTRIFNNMSIDFKKCIEGTGELFDYNVPINNANNMLDRSILKILKEESNLYNLDRYFDFNKFIQNVSYFTLDALEKKLKDINETGISTDIIEKRKNFLKHCKNMKKNIDLLYTPLSDMINTFFYNVGIEYIIDINDYYKYKNVIDCINKGLLNEDIVSQFQSFLCQKYFFSIFPKDVFELIIREEIKGKEDEEREQITNLKKWYDETSRSINITEKSFEKVNDKLLKGKESAINDDFLIHALKFSSNLPISILDNAKNLSSSDKDIISQFFSDKEETNIDFGKRKEVYKKELLENILSDIRSGEDVYIFTKIPMIRGILVKALGREYNGILDKSYSELDNNEFKIIQEEILQDPKLTDGLFFILFKRASKKLDLLLRNDPNVIKVIKKDFNSFHNRFLQFQFDSDKFEEKKNLYANFTKLAPLHEIFDNGKLLKYDISSILEREEGIGKNYNNSSSENLSEKEKRDIYQSLELLNKEIENNIDQKYSETERNNISESYTELIGKYNSLFGESKLKGEDIQPVSSKLINPNVSHVEKLENNSDKHNNQIR